MRVLISGHTARSANPHYARRSGVATVLESAYRAGGHDVVRGHWLPGEHGTIPDLDAFDLVLVGLNSPVSLMSGYAYSALSTIDELWGDDRLVLFPEDPDIGKVRDGAASVMRAPARLFTPFLRRSRTHFDLVEPDEALRTRVLGGVTNLLREDAWPQYLVPCVALSNYHLQLNSAPVGAGMRPVPVDLSPAYVYPGKQLHQRPWAHVWVTEAPATDPVLAHVITRFPVRQAKVFTDAQFGEYITSSYGLIEHDLPHRSTIGAWSVSPAIAAAAGAFFYGHHGTYGPWGDAYRVLPGAFEDMTANERLEIIRWQQETMQRVHLRRKDVTTLLESLAS